MTRSHSPHERRSRHHRRDLRNGRALAQQLAAAGGVALVTRDAAKGEAVRGEITRAVPNASLDLHLADLSSMADVRSLAAQLSAAHPRIDALVNCAAVFSSDAWRPAMAWSSCLPRTTWPRSCSLNLLLPPLRASGAARILTVTAPATVKLDFDDLQGRRRFRARARSVHPRPPTCSSPSGWQPGSPEAALSPMPSIRVGAHGPDAAVANPPARTHRAHLGPTRPRGGNGSPHCCWMTTMGLPTDSSFTVDARSIRPPNTPTTTAEVQRRLWEVSEELVGLT